MNSPGVKTTTTQNGVYLDSNNSTNNGVFAGSFTRGPINQPILIDSVDNLIKIFGKPTDYNYNDWFQCFNYLKYQGVLYVVRAGAPNKIISTEEIIVDQPQRPILNNVDWVVLGEAPHTWNDEGTSVTFTSYASGVNIDHNPFLGDHGYGSGPKYIFRVIAPGNIGFTGELMIRISTTDPADGEFNDWYIYADGSGTDLGDGNYLYEVEIDLAGYAGQINRIRLHQNMDWFPITFKEIVLVTE